jgi:molybdate transport system substrate-binding protein
MPLAVLSAGAAKAVVEALARETPGGIASSFGAVGTIREQFLSGARCDILILTRAMLDELADAGRVDRESIAPLGSVHTGVAVPAGVPPPAIGDRAALARTFGEATALYCPDIERATAGIHFVRVLRELDLYPALASRLRAFPSGAVAMRALAASGDVRAVGCTQVTEILYTPGVVLAGRLPEEFALATVYAAAVSSGANSPVEARQLVARLTGTSSAALRQTGGFEPVALTSS